MIEARIGAVLSWLSGAAVGTAIMAPLPHAIGLAVVATAAAVWVVLRWRDLDAVKRVMRAMIAYAPPGVTILFADDEIAESAGTGAIWGGRVAEGSTREEWAHASGIYDVRHPDGTPCEVEDMPALRALRGEVVLGQRLTTHGRSIVCSAWPVYVGRRLMAAVLRTEEGAS